MVSILEGLHWYCEAKYLIITITDLILKNVYRLYQNVCKACHLLTIGIAVKNSTVLIIGKENITTNRKPSLGPREPI